MLRTIILTHQVLCLYSSSRKTQTFFCHLPLFRADGFQALCSAWEIRRAVGVERADARDGESGRESGEARVCHLRQSHAGESKPLSKYQRYSLGGRGG